MFNEDYFPKAFTAGRAVAIVGTLLGWPLCFVLSTVLFCRFSMDKQLHILLAFVALILSALSLTLFVAMGWGQCHRASCEPNVVLAAIPAALFLLVTTYTMFALLASNHITTPSKLQL
jgi:hypothetical protein